MTKHIPKNLFGTIFLMQDRNRYAIFSSTIIIDDKIYYQAYPISFAVYMASDFDIILTDSVIFSDKPIIVEYWNPLLIKEPLSENIELLGKLEKDSFDILKEYLFKKLLAMPSKHKFFTGPPIASNQDIRLLFRKTELEIFLDCKKEVLISANLFQINTQPIKNTET